MVGVVANVEVFGAVRPDAVRAAQVARAQPALIAGVGREAASLAEHQIGSGVGGQRSVVLQYAVVTLVDGIEVAAAIQRHVSRKAEAARAQPALIASVGSETASL